jgi:hypothetical protein
VLEGMVQDKRSIPGPGHYEPRRTSKGDSSVTVDTEVSLTATKRFVADSGPSRDTSLRDYAITGPWASYPTARSSTAALQAVSPGSNGPGPDDIPGSVGWQILSTKKNSPIAPFGKAGRFRRPSSANSTPGPGAYSTTSGSFKGTDREPTSKGASGWSMGLKLKSTIQNGLALDTPGPEYDAHKALEIGGGHLNLSHSAAMAKGLRLKPPRDNGVPGPGFYKVGGSLGAQKLSQHGNQPTIHFTKKLRASDMPDGDPVFISRQHGADRLGRASPGPAMHVGRLTSKGSSFLGGASGAPVVAFTKDKKLRPHSKEGFYNPKNPGPGAYSPTHDSMGKQALSNRPTASSVPKISMEREVWDRQFLSAEHMRVEAQGKDSPGPMYHVAITSKSSASLAGKERGVRIGTGKRDSTVMRIMSPGPAAYSITREFERRPNSAPRKLVGAFGEKGTSFSTAIRPCLQTFDELAPRADLHLSSEIDRTLLLGYSSPGPGQYLNETQSSQLLTSFGKGQSLKNSKPTWRIGTGKRTQLGSRVRDAADEPGPGTYSIPTSFGKQTTSSAKTAGRVSMGKSLREKEAKVLLCHVPFMCGAQGLYPGTDMEQRD